MKSLNIKISSKKTWLERIKTDLSFTGNTSHLDSKNIQIKEQGSTTKHVGQHFKKWLSWGILATIIASPVHAFPGDPLVQHPNCSGIGFPSTTPAAPSISTVLTNVSTQWYRTAGNANQQAGSGLVFSTQTPFPSTGLSNATDYNFRVFSTVLPTTADIAPSFPLASTSNEPTASLLTQTIYMTEGQDTLGRVCVYSYDLVSNGGTIERRNFKIQPLLGPANANPTAVPLFTPLGLLATISGLLWFGRKRTIKLKHS